MPEAAFRFDLTASRRARQVRVVARALTGAAAVACAVALHTTPSAPRLGAVLAAAVAAVFAWRRGSDARSASLAIGADGAIMSGAGGAGGAGEAATARYCSADFVCLQAGRASLAVWPDALPPAAWRRLVVACRWPRGSAAAAGAVDGLRTK